jgi:NitT/TauT family transport system substrate-binding protein
MRRVKTIRAFIFCLLGLYCFSSKFDNTARSAELEKLNVVYSTIATASLTTWIPLEAGLYKKYGFDANPIYVTGSQAITTLISGDAQIAQASGAAGVISRLAGSDVSIIGAIINVIPMSLVATPDITSPNDLKGKTLGVSRFGSLTDLGLKKAISELGLDPAKDVKLIQTGGVPENFLFMQQGVIKAALISSPALEKAKDMGYRELLNLANIKFRYPGTALLTTDSFIRNRPQTLNRFLRATLEGIKYAKANPEFTMRIMQKYLRISDNKSLTSAFQTYVLGYIRNVPNITSTEIESVLEEISVRNPKAKGADPKQFYNSAPLGQLAKEGFIKELYPR